MWKKWKKWKFWDKYYKKSMLRAFAGRELKRKNNITDVCGEICAKFARTCFVIRYFQLITATPPPPQLFVLKLYFR